MPIKVLDKNVAELIAAGEVIEKPASVVKELVENSIDASARNITVEIKNGGVSFISIRDDGCGIPYEEAPTAFLRHATSKVALSEDLEGITTLGFRGEALASVAAVSKVTLLSKTARSELGVSYKIEGGEETAYEHAGCPQGTTIIIRDLFYNTPARLKFLKKDVSEGNSVQSVVDKQALIHPEISFKFIRDNKPTRVTAGDGKLYSSIYSVLGQSFAENLIPVDFSQYGINVNGYITSPLGARANRALQHFFVNSRYIRSAALTTALEEGYRNSIMTGKFPACVLNLTLPPESVDVNVHPAKTEVRFVNDRDVFDTVYFAVKNAVINAKNIGEISLSQKIAEPAIALTEPHKAAEQITLNASAETWNETIEQKLPILSKYEQDGRVTMKFPNPPESAELFPYANEPETARIKKNTFVPLKPIIAEKTATIPVTPQIEEAAATVPVKVIGELFGTYIVCESGEEMLLIDKHAADERLRFNKLRSELVAHSQLLVESASVKLGEREYNAVCGNQEALLEIGIEILPAENFTVEILAMPTLLESKDAPLILSETAERLAVGGNLNGNNGLFDEILHSIACRAAVKASDRSDPEDMRLLAERVIGDKTLRYCPHGRPVVIALTKREIEKFFNRIV